MFSPRCFRSRTPSPRLRDLSDRRSTEATSRRSAADAAGRLHSPSSGLSGPLRYSRHAAAETAPGSSAFTVPASTSTRITSSFIDPKPSSAAAKSTVRTPMMYGEGMPAYASIAVGSTVRSVCGQTRRSSAISASDAVAAAHRASVGVSLAWSKMRRSQSTAPRSRAALRAVRSLRARKPTSGAWESEPFFVGAARASMDSAVASVRYCEICGGGASSIASMRRATSAPSSSRATHKAPSTAARKWVARSKAATLLSATRTWTRCRPTS
mmetsp:Transcript_19770/g.66869  ORF Transcript_19770/g.66869 Transcript_19770/m.66869 type:complete len:269 (+) Transcript_19770:802-1608(+)